MPVVTLDSIRKATERKRNPHTLAKRDIEKEEQNVSEQQNRDALERRLEAYERHEIDPFFEHAIQQGIARAASKLRNVEGAWIKDMNVMIQDGNITGWLPKTR